MKDMAVGICKNRKRGGGHMADRRNAEGVSVTRSIDYFKPMGKLRGRITYFQTH